MVCVIQYMYVRYIYNFTGSKSPPILSLDKCVWLTKAVEVTKKSHSSSICRIQDHPTHDHFHKCKGPEVSYIAPQKVVVLFSVDDVVVTVIVVLVVVTPTLGACSLIIIATRTRRIFAVTNGAIVSGNEISV